MSFTFSSPNWESRNLETASYSYKPCWAVVVDFTFQEINFLSNDSAISSANKVFPVPGSPLTIRGFCKAMEALTAIFNPSEAM